MTRGLLLIALFAFCSIGICCFQLHSTLVIDYSVRDMVGKPFKHVKDFIDSVYLPFDIVEDSRGVVGIEIDDGSTVYSVEELLASNLSEFHAKIPVQDMVVSVPPYFGQAERRGLIQALQYGIDKDFANGSRHVIFYDIGSSSTYATLIYYSAYNEKEFGKTVYVNQFQVKDVRCDFTLGGQSMEMRLVEYFADEFNKQLGDGADVSNGQIEETSQTYKGNFECKQCSSNICRISP